MKYKKLPVNGYKVLNMYPVYVEDIYNGHEPFKIAGVREDQIELQGDFSGALTISFKKTGLILINALWYPVYVMSS